MNSKNLNKIRNATWDRSLHTTLKLIKRTTLNITHQTVEDVTVEVIYSPAEIAEVATENATREFLNDSCNKIYE